MKVNVLKSRRKRTIFYISFSLFVLLGIVVSSLLVGEDALGIDLNNKNNAPSFAHPFGTDWLGRDMLARTLKGLSLSLSVGLIAAIASTFIALVLSLLATWNKYIDRLVTGLIDLFLSVPHIVILLLISFAFGGGYQGVIIGLALTHWPSLTRVLRAEMLQIKLKDYVNISGQFGKSKLWIARHHLFPHVLPQMFVGALLLFPHAILHEAAITFLGFGLPAEQPAIGIILSESMRYLSIGMWWLAFFPGLCLLIMVGLFDVLGKSIQAYFDPFHSQR